MRTVSTDQALMIVQDAIDPIVRREALTSTELAGRIVAERTIWCGELLEEGTRLDQVGSPSGDVPTEVVVFSRPKMVVLASKGPGGPGCDLWIDPGLEMISKIARCRGLVPMLEEHRPGSCRQAMENNIGADLVVILPAGPLEWMEADRFCLEQGKVLFDHVSGPDIGTTFAIVGETPFLVMPLDDLEMARSALMLLYELAGRISRYATAPGDMVKVKMARTVEGSVHLLLVRTENGLAWPLPEDEPGQMIRNMDGFIIPGPGDHLQEGSDVALRRFRL
jgi:hypothetical protein